MFSKWDGSKMAGCSAGPMLPSIASSEQFKVRYSARTALLAFLGAGLGRVTISSIELQVVVYSNISSRVLRSSNACGCSQWWGDPRGSAARRVRSKFLLYWYNRGPLLYSNSMTHQCKTPTIFLFIFFFLVLEIELRASHMVGKCCPTTESHPQPFFSFVLLNCSLFNCKDEL
jgi:hypothetical protein